jgi:hypothetical protein
MKPGVTKSPLASITVLAFASFRPGFPTKIINSSLIPMSSNCGSSFSPMKTKASWIKKSYWFSFGEQKNSNKKIRRETVGIPNIDDDKPEGKIFFVSINQIVFLQCPQRNLEIYFLCQGKNFVNGTNKF